MSRGYAVEFRPRALRALRKLPEVAQRRLLSAIEALADDPRPSGVKKLKGGDGIYRLRVGTYRVLYQIRDDVLLVLVTDVGHRRDVYR